MKNLYIFGVHGKIRVLRGWGGGFTKTDIQGGWPKKGARTVSRFKRGGLDKKEGGGVFQGQGVLINAQ